MLRRLTGLCLSLLLITASFPALSTVPTYAQDGSPVAVDPDDTLESGNDSSSGASPDEVAPASEIIQPASEPGDTPAGSPVGPVFPLLDVYLTFAAVVTGGITTAYEQDSTSEPPLPDGYRLDNARIVHIETTASFQYNVVVCVIYNGANFADPASIRLFRMNESGWVLTDIHGSTSVASSTVCGYSAGLGTFAAAEFGTAPTPEPSRTATPVPSDTAVPTTTQTPTATDVAAVDTETPTPSITPTPSDTPPSTSTSTATASPTPTQTPTPTASATATPSSTPDPTETSTSTGTPSSTATVTISPTPPPTETSTSSATPTSTATGTATSTGTPTPTPSSTATFTATPTSATGQTQYALPNVWVTYNTPPSSGTEGVELDGSTLPPLPGQYRVANAWFFKISAQTTNGGKQVCVLFESSRFVLPSSATLLHSSGTSWTPLTGQVFSNLDAAQGTLCGYTNLLGDFTLAERLPATATATSTASRTATATPTPSNTATTPPTWTPTTTPTRTATPSGTPTETPSYTPTATSTETTVATHTPSTTPSSTPTPTQSPTSTATATATKTSTATSTPTNTPTSTSTPTLGPGSYPTGTILRVTTNVNLRSGPGTDSVSLGIVTNGTVVQVTGPSTASGGRIWVPVAIPTVGTGWIAGDYLVLAPTPTPTRTPAPPTATRTPGSAMPTRTATRAPGGFIAGDYVKTTTSLNLRSAPGTSSQVISVIPSGTIGRITASGVSSGGVIFYPVLFDGRPGGYVAGKYLQRITATPTPTRTVSPTATIAGVPTRWTNSNVNMRSGAGAGYRIVATLPEGSRVTITGNPKRSGGYDWYPVTAYGIGSGWIAGKFLSITWPT